MNKIYRIFPVLNFNWWLCNGKCVVATLKSQKDQSEISKFIDENIITFNISL